MMKECNRRMLLTTMHREHRPVSLSPKPPTFRRWQKVMFVHPESIRMLRLRAGKLLPKPYTRKAARFLCNCFTPGELLYLTFFLVTYSPWLRVRCRQRDRTIQTKE